MSTTLFLKYRPQTFADLVGQEFVVKTLQNALKSEKPAHSYLFVGSRGTGKTSMARIFAKGLNCLDLIDGAPCGKCSICTGIADGSLVDVIEIDAASYTGIDNIRDLREKANFMPNIAKRKIYIIDEVHMLSKSAFNGLLKTLEEPPEHVFFILATTEFTKVPETIVSRCQTFTFGRFSLEQLIERIDFICKNENFDTTHEALELIARKAEGGLRDAIGLLEQIAAETEGKFSAESVRNSLGISSFEQLESFFNAIETKNIDVAFTILKDINKQGGDFRSFGHDFLSFLREKMYASLSGNPEKLPRFIEQIELIEHALTRFKTSPLVELPLEIAVLKLCADGNVPLVQEKKAVLKVENSIPAEKKEVSQPGKDAKPQSSDFVFDSEKKEEEKTLATEVKPEPESMVKKEGTAEITIDRIISELQQIADSEGFPSFAKKTLLATRPQITGNKICFIANPFLIEQLQKAKIELRLQHALSKRLGMPIEEVSFRSQDAKQDSLEEKEKPASVTDLEF